jgi:hypothetical protein
MDNAQIMIFIASLMMFASLATAVSACIVFDKPHVSSTSTLSSSSTETLTADFVTDSAAALDSMEKQNNNNIIGTKLFYFAGISSVLSLGSFVAADVIHRQLS